MLSNTPAAPIADQMMKTATQVTMPNAIASRNAVFITDHGSIRDIRSRAFRVCGRLDFVSFLAIRACLASARSAVRSGLAAFTAAALSITACRAALTRSPNDSVFASGCSPYGGSPYDAAPPEGAPFEDADHGSGRPGVLGAGCCGRAGAAPAPGVPGLGCGRYSDGR